MAKQEANTFKHWLVVLEEKLNGGYTTLESITMKNGAYIKLDYAATAGFMYEGESSFNEDPSTTISSIASWPMIVCRNAPTTTASLFLTQDQTYKKTRFQFVSSVITMNVQTGESAKYRCEFKSGAGKLYLNDSAIYGYDVSTYSASSVANSYVCLGLNSVSTTFKGTQIIYDTDGKVVRKLTPAMRRKDGEFGLLDSVTGSFYSNANTSKTSYIEGGGRVKIEVDIDSQRN